jgi:hypothetical protein
LKFGIDDEIVACARFVAATTGTVAVRRRATGVLVWESEPQDMRDLTIELLDDLLLAEIDSERLQIYDLGSGTKVDELANESTLTFGPCLTSAGLYDANDTEVRCLWRADA